MDDKPTAILQATLDLITENGFHGAPMSQVAKRSGVSAGIIYHYFENKDDLIHALYKQIKAVYGQVLMANEPYKLPWPENVKCLWLNAYEFYVTHPKETIFLEQYENSPYAQMWDHLALDDNMRQLAEMMTNEFAAGHVREMPFEVLYELTMGVAIGLAKRQINGSVSLDEATLNTIAESCCRAIQP